MIRTAPAEDSGIFRGEVNAAKEAAFTHCIFLVQTTKKELACAGASAPPHPGLLDKGMDQVASAQP